MLRYTIKGATVAYITFINIYAYVKASQMFFELWHQCKNLEASLPPPPHLIYAVMISKFKQTTVVAPCVCVQYIAR